MIKKYFQHIKEAITDENEKSFCENLLKSFDPEIRYEIVTVFEDNTIYYDWIDHPDNKDRILERLVILSNEKKIKYSYIRTIRKNFTLTDNLYPEYEYKINAKKYNL